MHYYCRIEDQPNDNVSSLAASGNKIEEELRRRLAFHFMDPVDKFIARRQVPWKLLLQFLKGWFGLIRKCRLSKQYVSRKNLSVILFTKSFSYTSDGSTSCFWILPVRAFQLLQR